MMSFSSCFRGWDCSSHCSPQPPQQEWCTEDPEGPGAVWWQHEGSNKERAECWRRTQPSGITFCWGKHYDGCFSPIKKRSMLNLHFLFFFPCFASVVLRPKCWFGSECYTLIRAASTLSQLLIVSLWTGRPKKRPAIWRISTIPPSWWPEWKA